jgi:hypothetical protein
MVEVRDSGSGEPAACGATGLAHEGAYIEALTGLDDCVTQSDTWVHLLGAWERAGVYTVTIRKPGYQDWIREQVVVTADECHVRTVKLQADLIPESGQAAENS